jgi:hypothetical protein
MGIKIARIWEIYPSQCELDSLIRACSRNLVRPSVCRLLTDWQMEEEAPEPLVIDFVIIFYEEGRRSKQS